VRPNIENRFILNELTVVIQQNTDTAIYTFRVIGNCPAFSSGVGGQKWGIRRNEKFHDLLMVKI
jgi:hypothetical protein